MEGVAGWDDMDVSSRMSEVGKLEQFDQFPLLYTVEEAAAVLRIGRTLAYRLARRHETSGGREGLPVVRLGGCLRVPRWALMELACNGRVVALSELDRGDPRGATGSAPVVSRPTVVRIVSRSATSATRPPTSQVPSLSRAARSRRPRQLQPVEQLVLLPSD